MIINILRIIVAVAWIGLTIYESFIDCGRHFTTIRQYQIFGYGYFILTVIFCVLLFIG